MIINSIKAENVLKYSILEIDDIPPKGLIAVTGDNESGKSSIGECICFALFGRTFSLGPDELDKVIRWGESRCSIRLEFTTPDGLRYQIARFLDEKGNHGASIAFAGDEPMVRGLEEVDERLKAIIGFGYIEFIESFYLAQREISTPNPHSFAVKAMAGVDAMERATTSCRDEQDRLGDQLDETRAEKSRIDAQIAELNLVEGYLDSLESQHRETGLKIEQDRRDIEVAGERTRAIADTAGELSAGSEHWLAVETGRSYHDRLAQAQGLDAMLATIEPECVEHTGTKAPFTALRVYANDARAPLIAFDTLRDEARAYVKRLRHLLSNKASGEPQESELPFATRTAALSQEEKQLRSRRRMARLAAFLLLMLAVILGIPWEMLAKLTQSSSLERLMESPIWPLLVLRPWTWIAAAGAALTCIGLVSWSKRLSAGITERQQAQEQLARQRTIAQDEVVKLTDLDELPLWEATSLLAELQNRDIADLVPIYISEAGAPLLDEDSHRERQREFSGKVNTLIRALADTEQALTEQAAAKRAAVERGSDDLGRLAGMIREEEERVRRFLELNAVAENLQIRGNDITHRIRVRELATDLLSGAVHYISQRFNTEVRNLSAESLPKFTNGRYEHLQIDENLNVKAFSNEKRDFMQLDEISSGTQRQIMLAVRMALSQKLVNSVIQGPQMIYLDEPFAFFDETRTASSLAVLPSVSADFTQIWVTSQTFPPQSQFDIHIECNARESLSPWINRGDAEQIVK